MKKHVFIYVLIALFFSGCGLSKKVKKNEQREKTTETTTETTSETTNTVKETQPTESRVVFDIKDLEKMMDGFTQSISAGSGSGSEITKRDGKLIVINTTAGSKDSESSVKETENKTVYDSEFILKETKKVIKKLPWWIWIGVLIFFRKFIAQILILIFPGSRILKIFSGSK